MQLLIKVRIGLALFCFSAFAYALAPSFLRALSPSSLSPSSLSPHIDYSASIAIDSKNTHTYTVKFAQSGDTTRRVTSYFDNTKRLVRQETTHFQAKQLKLYLNKIEDFRTGEYLFQTSTSNGFAAQHRERKGAELEERSIKAEHAIPTTLVSERVAQSIEAVDRGENVTFFVALPLHGIVAEMSITKASNEVVNGVPCVTIRFEPSNFLFKILMGDPSFFTFERAKPNRFMQYNGVLGLTTAEGKRQNGFVVIKY
ncbi:MAG: hypothetical protein EAZ92_03920 [Candidatus Kapaibacterium sp.]|nr:MAG: hypothetical protein EAZ92_03920 [Candidatus Kapabacteria bacterium]